MLYRSFRCSENNFTNSLTRNQKQKKNKKKTIDILEKSILRIAERQEEEQDINVERRERSTAKHPLVGITTAVTSF